MIKSLAAVTSGLLLTAAFPKVDQPMLAWFALVPLLAALKGTRPKAGFRLGFTAGLVHYMTLLYWVANTMNVYGQLPLYLCVPVLFLFAAYLALYMGTFSSLAPFLYLGSAYRLLMLPMLWVALEYLRSTLFTGFPWELLGYSQYKVLPVIQIADLFGVYGVSFLIVLVNTAIYQAFLLLGAVKGQKDHIAAGPAAISIAAVTVITAVVWLYGTTRIAATDRQAALAPVTRVAVIQGNIDQAVKWNKAFQTLTTEKYVRLSISEKLKDPALIVWPETATPFYFLHHGALTGIVMEGIRKAGVHFLLGSNSVEQKDDSYRFYNSAYLVTPGGTVSGRYDKVHLVPYGEYVPFKKWMPFLGKIVQHVGDFQTGKKGDTLRWGAEKLGILICYEIIFPNLSSRMVNNGATLLINITNDAWYGRSSAPYQHFSMAVFRAVENRRALARSANTGISGFIDPVGRVTGATSLYQDAALTRTVPLLKEKTVYNRIGDLFAATCLAWTSGMAIWVVVRRRRRVRLHPRP